MLPVLIVAGAYLLGSIPFGYLIARRAKGGDVRETGSGGTGATNVMRRAGKRAGVITLALDTLKGLLAVLFARWAATPDFGINWWVAAATLAVVLGHIFPVWLGFRGGKGVATGLGAFLSLSPLAVGGAAVCFVIVVWATRYVSLGSIVAAIVLPLCLWLVGGHADTAPLVTAAIVGGAFIILMHRANIGRLMRGEENKLK